MQDAKILSQKDIARLRKAAARLTEIVSGLDGANGTEAAPVKRRRRRRRKAVAAAGAPKRRRRTMDPTTGLAVETEA